MHRTSSTLDNVGEPAPIAPADLETGQVNKEAAGAFQAAPEQQQNHDDSNLGYESHRLAPSTALTGHQIFYIFVLDGLGAMLLSGGVNFALAYAMYVNAKGPVVLWRLPNTLAGDAAVTIIVQCILTWFVELGLLRYDLSHRSVQPIGFIPEPRQPVVRWLFFLKNHSSHEASEKRRIPLFLGHVLQNALRGFFLAVLGFFLLWPISVGVLITIGEKFGGDYKYSFRWTPQAFKCILGGVLGLLTTPLMATFWLLKAGWEH